MAHAATVAVAASAPSSGLSPLQTELLSRADSIFAAIGNTVSKASDLAIQGGKAVAEQIPDVAFQYVAFGRASSSVILLIAATFIAIGVWLALRYGFHNAHKAPNDRYNEWATSRWFAVAFGAISTVVGTIVFFANVKDFLMVWFAPKVWLLLELAELIKRVRS